MPDLRTWAGKKHFISIKDLFILWKSNKVTKEYNIDMQPTTDTLKITDYYSLPTLAEIRAVFPRQRFFTDK